jgi:multiple sugar transport system substrate-binding protein
MSGQGVSRRQFLKISGMSLAAVGLAACAPAAPQPGAGEGAAPSSEVVTISFMGWGNPGEDEGVRNAIAVFEEETPNVKVTWMHTPENYAEKFLANVAAGTPPDTAFVGSDVYRTYIRDVLLLDITDYLELDPLLGAENYFIEPQESERCTVDGRWYGIGSCWVAPHIYYNADIFEAEGIEPPSNDPDEAWTWEQFVDTARALTVDVNGNHPGDSGFDVQNVDRWGVHWDYSNGTVLYSAVNINGAHWIEPDTLKLDIDTPAGVEAIQNLADLMLVHQVMPQSTAFQGLGMTNTQMLENGKLAMAIDGSWALDWMKNMRATLGTSVLPQMSRVATNMQAHLHSGMSGSKNPDAAWAWVRFLSTPFYQTQFCRTGLWLPSQTALMTEEGLTEWITEGVHPTDYYKIATEYLPRFGMVLYQPIGWPRANSVIQPALDAIWIGDMTAEEALTAAVPEANAILEEEQART